MILASIAPSKLRLGGNPSRNIYKTGEEGRRRGGEGDWEVVEVTNQLVTPCQVAIMAPVWGIPPLTPV